ncbi:hypothetical protein ANCCEY_04919 [Ancylostoma ceylanicum]|uniref:Uncharacterized protein n=1 Tax=Ancylostoma ceylanicum TaxID=53326 RepID=A0A0D6LXS4_9BILA|nr:hypothetical protein ANCCEY_04919 [Ancylostoma ceylanicum]
MQALLDWWLGVLEFVDMYEIGTDAGDSVDMSLLTGKIRAGPVQDSEEDKKCGEVLPYEKGEQI